jgi:hypothetical protein
MGILKKMMNKKMMKPKPRPMMPRRKPRTQLIDPKLPRGKVGKGPLEPRDSTTRVPAAQLKKLKRFSNMAERPKKDNPASSYGGNAIMALDKGPGMKKGGSVMGYKDGGCVPGAANRRRMMQEMVNK